MIDYGRFMFCSYPPTNNIYFYCLMVKYIWNYMFNTNATLGYYCLEQLNICSIFL